MDTLYAGLFTRLSGMTDDEKCRVCEWLVEAGVDMYTVKTLLGHQSLSMAERYSHLSQGALRQAVAKLRQSINDSEAGKVVALFDQAKP